MYIYIHICIYTSICIYIYKYIYKYLHTYVYIDVSMRIIYIYTYVPFMPIDHRIMGSTGDQHLQVGFSEALRKAIPGCHKASAVSDVSALHGSFAGRGPAVITSDGPFSVSWSRCHGMVKCCYFCHQR